MNADVAVILPSYNSSNTIVKLIEDILNGVKKSLVVVVDDNSPDKTANLVKKKFKSNNRVLLIMRKEKGGRGSAVIRGFKEGLKFPSVKYFIEMDVDLCHDPKFINPMIRATKNADVIIASRYLKKSKNIHWKLKRKIFSACVSLLLKSALQVPIRDYTNGFRCYKRAVIESFDFNQIKSKGFIVLSELAYYLHKRGFRFREIPITFRLYEFNPSNLNLREVKEALFAIMRLRFGGV